MMSDEEGAKERVAARAVVEAKREYMIITSLSYCFAVITVLLFAVVIVCFCE